MWSPEASLLSHFNCGHPAVTARSFTAGCTRASRTAPAEWSGSLLGHVPEDCRENNFSLGDPSRSGNGCLLLREKIMAGQEGFLQHCGGGKIEQITFQPLIAGKTFVLCMAVQN